MVVAFTDAFVLLIEKDDSPVPEKSILHLEDEEVEVENMSS